MKKDYIMPIIVLPVLCLVVSGGLAICHNITYPVILKKAAERAEAAKRDIIPQADGFELLKMDGLPKTIDEVYRTTNNTGFIFLVRTLGYGGEIELMCGISPDGKIIKTTTLAQSETKGLGTPVFDEPHAGQYWGSDKHGIEEIHAISGATISSTAYKNGLRDALAAFEIVKGVNK
jgi:electron transport complex protein RnfG